MAATNHAEFYRGVEAAAAALAAASSPSPDDARAEAAARVHSAFDRLANESRDTHACREGCAHCCHFPVGVGFAEAARLARAVAPRADLRAKVLAAAAAVEDLPWGQLVGRACPLLEGDACAVYAARPLPCRSLASRDARACAAALAGDAVAVPRDEARYWRGLGAGAELARRDGIPPRELRAAVAALLGAPDDAPAARAAFAACRPAAVT
jgi:hypothetical protein